MTIMWCTIFTHSALWLSFYSTHNETVSRVAGRVSLSLNNFTFGKDKIIMYYILTHNISFYYLCMS